MRSLLNALARLLGRRKPDDSAADKGSAVILIREGEKVLSGEDLYREVATANDAESAAELKAFGERINRNMPG
jgi:hypothetical protein